MDSEHKTVFIEKQFIVGSLSGPSPDQEMIVPFHSVGFVKATQGEILLPILLSKSSPLGIASAINSF